MGGNMTITRKEFLQMTAGAVTYAAVSSSSIRAAVAGKPKRGVSLYSYTGDFGVTMSLEDCFADMRDMDAEGLEILANTHIEGYPNPSEAWIKRWFALLEKYKIKPSEYGHWVDSRLHKGRELSTKESYDMLLRDIKLANRLGFPVMRTKLGVIDDTLTPVKNWREFIEMALPDAEKYNVKMCPEIHQPTRLKSKMLDDYVEFIVRTKTKHFGINIDFGVFQSRPRRDEPQMGGRARPFTPGDKAEDMVPLLPYVYACHAKFWEMTDELTEATIPYDEVLGVLIKHGWDGYMLSEYEGPRDLYAASDQLRRQHVMLKRLLGET
jgi:sugar phosphate isomerase/epimerase